MKRKERSCKQFACRTAFLFFSSKFRGATACTGKASRLMRMQGKTPKGLRARQQCAHSASRTARPVADQTWPHFPARRENPGTLCGCRGGLTMQPRKRGSCPASFSYGTPAKPFLFFCVKCEIFRRLLHISQKNPRRVMHFRKIPKNLFYSIY